MAEMRYLSAYLDGFKTSYDGTGGLQLVSSAKSQLVADLTTISNEINEAITNFTSAANDPQVTDLNEALTLAKSGIDRTKDHVEGDISGLLASTSSLRQDIIQAIIDKHNKGKSLNTNFLEDLWNSTGGALLNAKTGTQSQIDSLNAEIDRLNKKGEAQLVAIEQGINGVRFGVIGNMVDKGSLGPSVEFSANYQFDGEAWEKANPVYKMGFLQNLGCAVVGAVESIVKVGEGIVDAVLTPVAGVVSLIKGDDDHILKKAIEYDVAGNLIGGTAGALIAGSKEAYDQSGGRSFGNLAGNVVAHGALWVSGLGVLSAVSIGGNRAESVIQNGGTVGEGLWRGAAAGALSYTAAKILPKVTSTVSTKVSAWASTHNNIVAKGINGVSNIASRLVKAGGTKFKDWGTLGTKGKIVSAISSPIRGTLGAMNKAINSGAKVLTNTIGKTKLGTALIKVDKQVDTLIQTGRAKMTKAGRQAIKDYESARSTWEANGKQMNSAEYDQMVKANEKIPESIRPAIGEKAYTTTDLDNLADSYNRKNRDWVRAGKPTSGPEYDALHNAYDRLPASTKPATIGDIAYKTRAVNALANDYNQATTDWLNNGQPSSGPIYDAMKAAHDNLPTSLHNSTTIGKFAAETGLNDYAINAYNNKLTDWKLAGEPTSGPEFDAMKKAFDFIPDGPLKPTNIGDTGISSLRLRTLQRRYNNDLTTWVTNGSQQYGVDYQNLTNSWNNLPSYVKTAQAGDPFGTNIALSTKGEKLAGAFISGGVGASIQK